MHEAAAQNVRRGLAFCSRLFYYYRGTHLRHGNGPPAGYSATTSTTGARMDVATTSLKEVPLLEAKGDIDHNSCEVIETALNKALDAGARVILLDLSQASYIDSGGLSVIFSAARRLRPDGWMGVISPNDNIRRLLELVGLSIDPSFRLFGERQEAEAALS